MNMHDHGMTADGQPTVADMQATLELARAVARSNSNIIERVLTEHNVTARLYELNFDVFGKATVSEKQETIDVEAYLKKFEYPGDVLVEEVPGFTYIKRDILACKRWDDVVLLNGQFEEMIIDLDVYGNGSYKAVARSQQILHNLEAIRPEAKADKLNQLTNSIITAAGTSMSHVNITSNVLVPGILRTTFHLETMLQHGTLIYRGTRDGFGAADFHRCCDSKGGTVTLIKSTGGNVFGGYNPDSWSSIEHWLITNGAFIFTLKNPGGSAPTQFKLGPDANGYAVYNSAHCGPTWGAGFDIYIADGCNTTACSSIGFPKSYHDTTSLGQRAFTSKRNFQVAEIEVYTAEPCEVP